MPSVVDNASINRKVLITPTLAILALAWVCLAALRGFGAETTASALVLELEQHRLRPAAEAREMAAGLQTDMFRLIALGFMGIPRDKLQPIADRITTRSLALNGAIGTLVRNNEDPIEKTRLRDALTRYQAQSSHAVVNFLNSLGFGATTARNAAVALDGVIAEVALQERAAQARVVAATSAASALNRRQKAIMLAVLGLGSPLMIGASLLVARCIAGPIRQLTAAMEQIANRHYDQVIPATAQRDEVGSMARAVQVFKHGMIQADSLLLQQQATQIFLDAVLEHVPSPILVKRAEDLTFVHINRAAEAYLGVTRSEVMGRSMQDLLPADDDGAMMARDREALSLGTVLTDQNAEVRTLSMGSRLARVMRVRIPDESGAPLYLLTVMEDVTVRRKAEARIAYMAHYDALTDLPNRTLFAERLDDALAAAQRDGTQVAVLGLDLDRFKLVNDTQGHAAGDKLLQMVGQRMLVCLREGDTLARVGGDEFAAVLRGLRRQSDAETLAARLIEAVATPFDLGGVDAAVGLSVGIAFSPSGSVADDLIKRADMALYDAKAAGRGCARCFVPEMDAKLRQRSALESDLRMAVGTSQLTLHYQPQVDLSSFAVVGVEVLMRWNRPGYGNVLPSEFIPIAEESGLIAPMGVWLLNEAIAEAMRWPAHMRVAINVSPVQLRLPNFTRAVLDALASSGLDPARLELEVTEGVLLQDNAETIAGLTELRTLGVRLALDDFGTGFASLAYLRKFRFDTIKIDRSFVQGMATNASAGAIVRAMVALSVALGMRTNADGVESEAEIELLRAYGCNEAQGYRFFRPMPADQIRALIAGAPAQPADLLFARAS